MSKAYEKNPIDKMRAEYDFRGGIQQDDVRFLCSLLDDRYLERAAGQRSIGGFPHDGLTNDRDSDCFVQQQSKTGDDDALPSDEKHTDRATLGSHRCF